MKIKPKMFLNLTIRTGTTAKACFDVCVCCQPSRPNQLIVSNCCRCDRALRPCRRERLVAIREWQLTLVAHNLLERLLRYGGKCHLNYHCTKYEMRVDTPGMGGQAADVNR